MASKKASSTRADVFDEKTRLEKIEYLGILDSRRSDYFDAVVRLAADLFSCPISLISVIGEHVQWNKATCGFDLQSIPRADSFCSHAMTHGKLMVVEDTTADARFRANPFVVKPPHIRFYAGYPIRLSDGHLLGAICVKDVVTRTFSDRERERLTLLGQIVEGLVHTFENEVEARDAQQFGQSQKLAANRQSDLFEQIATVSGVGGWELFLDDMEPIWTQQTRKIHEVDEDYVPTLESAIEFYAPEARAILEQAINRAVEKGESWDLELPFITARNNERWVHSVGKAACVDGKPVRLFGSFRDITNRKNDEMKLRDSERLAREAEEELAVTLANMHEGVCVFDNHGDLRLWNRRYIEIFDKPAGEVEKGMNFRRILRNEIRRGSVNVRESEVTNRLNEHLAAGTTTSFNYRLGNGRSVNATYAPMPGGGWVATYSDVTDKEEASRRIEHAANHDTLTGLANRSLLNNSLEGAIATARDRGSYIGLMLIDIDWFKPINDSFGHIIGDELLKAVAERIKNCAGRSSLVARQGGDEFAILFKRADTHRKRLETVAADIVRKVTRPFQLEGLSIEVTASIGIAMMDDPKDTAETLVSKADSALYKMKESGRGSYRFFDEEIATELTRKKKGLLALHTAVKERDFELHYQPVVDLSDYSRVGYEALIRLSGENGEVMRPDEFIPLAEDFGLIHEIGEWVIETGLREAATWPHHLGIALNVSPRQFGHGVVVKQIDQLLTTLDMDPDRLDIEIIETTLLHASPNTIQELHALDEIGVNIVLDDFGTGFSSMTYVQQFPFDKIKIDRSFVRRIESDRQASIIASTIAALANNLGKHSTAEGIENENQAALLRTAGFQFGQGFLFGKPMPAHEIEELNPDRGKNATR
ncbi:EAL domain-containing protein [Hoeflea sp. WL0058]|uniref:EAL domain-containing protein n=1 Tax=Flavimaribacter sediminis TaxID=2865987 RepID=A0AAE2ZPD0_9HYPH|nr:EAL domain-containing protein [Flavimaribacter sediminis]MBW8638023.1 EAL domain-containing protein [Flavimaribacter sediminis]